MSAPPSGPDSMSWMLAAFRGLHPVRWALSAIGLAVCAVILAGASAFWFTDGPQLSQWFREPGPSAIDFGSRTAGRSTFAIVIRIGVLFIVFAGLWSLIGCWIARHELLARRQNDPYGKPTKIDLTPTRLVIRNFKTLVVMSLLIVAFCGILILPVAFAGLLNHIGGVGAIIVAVLLPIILIANVLLICIGVGLVAWPLMPVTIAAENTDSFDALSRAYNYTLVRPIRFVLLNIVAIAIAALPLAGTLYAIAGPMGNWLAASGHPATWTAAALSVSIYWSLQSLVYLHMRLAVDATDHSELVLDAAPPSTTEATTSAETTEQPKKPKKKSDAAPSRKGGLVSQFVLAFALIAGSWLATVWLFTRFGGEDAKWLTWGMGDSFRPDVEGLYAIASLIGGFWGLLCFIAPFMVTIRRAIKGDDPPTNTKPE